MKIFKRPIGTITSRFANYESHRTHSHTGIDFKYKFKAGRHAMHDGFVYKILNRDPSNLQEYRNIYQLCQTPIGIVEIAYVHCWDILINEGEFAKKGQIIYTEGNTGELVYSNGKKVLPSEKHNGKGSHAHIAVRPVVKVKRMKRGHHYLRNVDSTAYRDQDKYYYEIVHRDNGARGRIDFEIFLYEDTREVLINAIRKAIGLIQAKIDNHIGKRQEFDKQAFFGQKNAYIAKIQNKLKELGHFPSTVVSTGYYGKITSAAVMDFQLQNKVASETEISDLQGRIIGPKTLEALNKK